LTKLHDSGAEALIELDERILRPQALPDGFSRDDFAGPFEQGDQQKEWLPLDFHAMALAEHFLRSWEDLIQAESVAGRGLRRRSHVISIRKA
jgi:hypothetical protein